MTPYRDWQTCIKDVKPFCISRVAFFTIGLLRLGTVLLFLFLPHSNTRSGRSQNGLSRLRAHFIMPSLRMLECSDILTGMSARLKTTRILSGVIPSEFISTDGFNDTSVDSELTTSFQSELSLTQLSPQQASIHDIAFF